MMPTRCGYRACRSVRRTCCPGKGVSAARSGSGDGPVSRSTTRERPVSDEKNFLLDEETTQDGDVNILAKVRPAKEPADSSQQVSILRRFDFESKLMRMSVIVKNHQDGSIRVHLKGSPEKVEELCIPETIPRGF